METECDEVHKQKGQLDGTLRQAGVCTSELELLTVCSLGRCWRLCGWWREVWNWGKVEFTLPFPADWQ